MAERIVPFTDNFRDLSNQNGYQFEFVCERCGNGYRSEFVRDKVNLGRGLLRSAGSLFGGKLDRISGASEQLMFDRGTNSPAKDKALREAGESVRDEFMQCRGCGDWMCKAVCWNHEIGQCLRCSPSVAEEISKAQAAAQVRQIQDKVETIDWTKDLDLEQRAKVTCPSCHAKVEGGKFCPECGEKLAVTQFCTNCGTEMKDGAKFCAECGQKT
jgi:hypothetical protein